MWPLSKLAYKGLNLPRSAQEGDPKHGREAGHPGENRDGDQRHKTRDVFERYHVGDDSNLIAPARRMEVESASYTIFSAIAPETRHLEEAVPVTYAETH
jgi:hypothetical protein